MLHILKINLDNHTKGYKHWFEVVSKNLFQMVGILKKPIKKTVTVSFHQKSETVPNFIEVNRLTLFLPTILPFRISILSKST